MVSPTGQNTAPLIRSVITGWGSYLPEKIMTNHDLAQFVDTDDEWVVQRTGIKQRHIANETETTGYMALKAAEQALKKANLMGSDIDMIVLATTTPDQTFPATAVSVQAKIGMTQGMAFDVQAVCSGFVYALSVADNFIKAGQVKRALVIGAEKFSNLLDWNDRTTCVLFGDGAGCVILEADNAAKGNFYDRGILSTHLHSDGRLQDMLYVDGGAGTTKTIGVVHMEGKDVFKHAVQNLGDVVHEVLQHHGIPVESIDWLVPHQANIRIIETTAKKLHMPMEKVIVTVDHHGNTSAASIPLAFAEALDKGRMKKGQLVLLEAMGAGFTWGAALVRL